MKAENERFVPTIQWTETINISDDEQGPDLEGRMADNTTDSG